MTRQGTRSPIAHAIGLGSAKSGVEHWWAERVSAIALIPLTSWLLISLVSRSRTDYADFIIWLQKPGVMVAMILLLIFLFHHVALGLQVVIADYVHSGAKYAAGIFVCVGCFALAIAGIVATLKVGIAG